jgi:hypothetical protein
MNAFELRKEQWISLPHANRIDGMGFFLSRRLFSLHIRPFSSEVMWRDSAEDLFTGVVKIIS